jgi:hypothetical protein
LCDFGVVLDATLWFPGHGESSVISFNEVI